MRTIRLAWYNVPDVIVTAACALWMMFVLRMAGAPSGMHLLPALFGSYALVSLVVFLARKA